MGNKQINILFLLIIISLIGILYHQHQEIEQLKIEIEYHKNLADARKGMMEISEKNYEAAIANLEAQLKEAQAPIIYSNNTLFPSEQERAYTDMLEKINRNLDQQYYDSIGLGY